MRQYCFQDGESLLLVILSRHVSYLHVALIGINNTQMHELRF